MKNTVVVRLLVCLSVALQLPSPAHSSQARDSGLLTNADVIELQKLKLGDDVTLEKIKTSSTSAWMAN